MGIQIEVPFEALGRPGVARALADLMVSLGGTAAGLPITAAAAALTPAAAPAAKAEPAAAKVPAGSPYAKVESAPKVPTDSPYAKAAPAPKAAAPAPKAPEPVADAPKRRGRPPKSAAAAPAPAAKPKGKPGRKKGTTKAVLAERKAQAAAAAASTPAPVAAAHDGTAAARWNAYYNSLPDASRAFVDLLKSRQTLTVNDAVAELNLSSPKAMGGLTGAMARWAPKAGATLPFEARNNAAGVRTWVWLGHSD